jgi:CO dehydrogenase/acetyl-CoA synthase alpha subunit
LKIRLIFIAPNSTMHGAVNKRTNYMTLHSKLVSSLVPLNVLLFGNEDRDRPLDRRNSKHFVIVECQVLKHFDCEFIFEIKP